MRPVKRLEIVIVGAGIGGLAAAVTLGRLGHNVTVLEAAPKIMEIGAGIQVAPNMLRILDTLNIGQQVRAKATRLEQVQILRWENGARLFTSRVDQSQGEQLVIHRADLHMALLYAARDTPCVQVRENAAVVDVDLTTARPTARLQTSEAVTGDLLIAADGIKSLIRSRLLNQAAETAIPTGDSVFRLQLPREALLGDPNLRHYIEENIVRRWIGPDRHVVAYPVRNHAVYNIVMAHPDGGGADESWTKPGSREDMLHEFAGWDTDLVAMLNLVPDEEILAWKLCTHTPLRTWVGNATALLGDACHPMLPYVAQGAAQAVEDAAALGAIFAKVTSRSQIQMALHVYEKVRKKRTEKVQSFGLDNRASLHLHDGPEQVARDRAFALNAAPDRWVDQTTRSFLWDWDAKEVVRTVWDDFVGGGKDGDKSGHRASQL